MENTFYGQNKEDLIMFNHIKDTYGSNYIGNIIEIGANDGFTLSNSKLFRDKGWKAFLVEPGKKSYQLLIKNPEQNCQYFNIALGDQNSVMKFYESGEHLFKNDVGLVSSLILDETTRWKKNGVKYEEYDVECLTWKTFLSKFKLDNESFDIISIDIEGLDYELLIQMDLNKLECKLLCIEFNGKRKDDFVNYLKNFDMKLIHENAENLIFSK